MSFGNGTNDPFSDGHMRHTITKGTVNYWPNRFESCPPAKPSEGAYVDYPQKVAGMKARLRSNKFKEVRTPLSMQVKMVAW